jgi:pyruvate dehydrogenase E1 component alpha subunit
VDPDRYRSKEEVQQGRSHDPISAFGERLKAAGFIDDNGLQQIEQQVDQEVDEAVRFADESPDPPVEELFHYMYAPSEGSQGEK